MVKRIIQFATLFAALFHGCPLPIANAQDMTTLIDVARANGECLNNYDVSFKIISIADPPKDPVRLEELKREFKERSTRFFDEKRITGRLVVDKASTLNPVKIVFVINRQFLLNERVVDQYTDFMAWQDGLIADGTTNNPSGEIARGKQTLERCYRSFGIPSFETFYGQLSAPEDNGYWENHDVFWDRYKAVASDRQLVRLRNGRLREGKSHSTYRTFSEYDPISSLLVSRTLIPFDGKTGEELLESAVDQRVSWENINGVYRIKSIAERDVNLGLMSDQISTYHWHQFNEEQIEFPSDILKDISLERCTKFLIDGQSELSNEEKN
ncbi:MAG: hypothetical protein ACK5PB_08740 [Pirellula sp.]|jgi:hypothetical protein